MEKDTEVLQAQTVKEDFWSRDDAQEVLRKLARLQERAQQWSEVSAELEELILLSDLLGETSDADLEGEFFRRSAALKKTMEKRQLTLLLNDEYDENDAILTIHPGAGGMDSADWADMLHRMYLRWAEIEGFQTTILDLSPDIEAGIKSATVLVKGAFAYGYLKAERGVHRLVRISPFDAAKRRHTSFASLGVAPEMPEDAGVEIRSEDLKMDTFRASGAGGQYVNMTDSAVRITHIPSGIIVSCQVERSQHMNRATAMRILRARLFERTLQERQEKLEALGGEKKEIGWGSQIRSYVLHPYTLVKDHRTNYEVGNVQAVLGGELQDFIMAYLRWKKKNQ